LDEESMNWTVRGAVPDVTADTKEPAGAVASAGIITVMRRLVARKRARTITLMAEPPYQDFL
jgi:hypothetical protein